jgi:hypothetical protein
VMSRGPRGERRPADVIGNAVHVMRIATGEIEDIPVDAATASASCREQAPHNDDPFVRFGKTLNSASGRIKIQWRITLHLVSPEIPAIRKDARTYPIIFCA